jgi:tellurium resistance protein TerD
MSYKIKKGESYSFSKNLNQYYIGLGWDINQSGNGYQYDLDVVALLLNDLGWLLPPPYGVVFYNNPCFPHLPENEWMKNGKRNEELIRSQAIWISSDNRDGFGDGDDEFMKIDFSKLTPNVHQIVIAACIYDGNVRRQSFQYVKNSFIRIAAEAHAPDVVRYDLNQNFGSETCMILGRLYKKNEQWSFEAMGKATHDSLETLIDSYS